MLNKKGTILPVTIVSMTIMMTIGIICLQMFSAQNILNTYDQAKLRTFYSAEGAVEMMRGYIDYAVAHNSNATYGDNHESGKGFLNWKTKTGKWEPLKSGAEHPVLANYFDSTMHPKIKASAYCERLTAAEISSIAVEVPAVAAYNNYASGEQCAYKIVAIASTTHKTNLATQLIVSTVTYYFATKRRMDGSKIVHDRKFVCWRRD